MKIDVPFGTGITQNYNTPNKIERGSRKKEEESRFLPALKLLNALTPISPNSPIATIHTNTHAAVLL